MSYDYNQLAQAYEKVKQNHNIINLSESNPQEVGIQFPSELLTNAFTRFASSHIYHPISKGTLTAREAICQYYQDNNTDHLSADQILLTAGTSESYLHIFRLLTNADDEILVPQPCYPLFSYIANHARINLSYYQLNDQQNWQLDVTSLQQAISPKTKAIVIISPHNPTGHVLNCSEWQAIISLANQHNLAIILDEVFNEFTWHQPFYRPPLQTPNLMFTLNGLSKMKALAWTKLAWIIVSGNDSVKVHQMVDTLETQIDTYLTCNSFIQEALPDILHQTKAFQQHYFDTLKQRNAYCESKLQQTGLLTFTPADGGFYRVVTLKNRIMNEEKLVIDILNTCHIYIQPSFFYNVQGIETSLIISHLPTLPVLESALDRLNNYLFNYLQAF